MMQRVYSTDLPFIYFIDKYLNILNKNYENCDSHHKRHNCVFLYYFAQTRMMSGWFFVFRGVFYFLLIQTQKYPVFSKNQLNQQNPIILYLARISPFFKTPRKSPPSVIILLFLLLCIYISPSIFIISSISSFTSFFISVT